jgi:hypothetical protein
VLASESDELVALATLRDLDSVLVGPLLDLAVTPAVQEGITEGSLGGLSSGGGGVVLGSGAVRSDLSVAADRRDQLVASAGLRHGNAALIEPGLEVGVRPGLVEPVTRVGSGLAGLVGNGLVVGAGSLEERVAAARGWVGDVVVVEESLELRLSPAGRWSV